MLYINILYKHLHFAGMTITMMATSVHAEEIAHWKMLADKSSIKWVVSYSSKPVEGTFPSFTSDIAFDPAHLDKSSVNASIATAKVTSTDSDAQGSLAGGEWLAAS